VIRAVVFDFDGVIANSEPLHFRAFRDVLSGRGITLTEREYYDRYLGYDDVGAFRAIANDRHLTFSDSDVAGLLALKAIRVESLERERSVLFPGARQAIERMARACPIAIASGARKAEILRVLEHEQLASSFTIVVAAEDTAVSKPAPDPYVRAVTLLAAATDLALDPVDCVAVEDSRWGLESAHAAGLKTVAISHTYPAEELAQADLVIGHLDLLTWTLLATFDGPRDAIPRNPRS
jgi:HAD superfamily hydrolase (TIGR01509 family)